MYRNGKFMWLLAHHSVPLKFQLDMLVKLLTVRTNSLDPHVLAHHWSAYLKLSSSEWGDQQHLCNPPEGLSWGSKDGMSLEGFITKRVSETPSLALWSSQQCLLNPNFDHILCSAFISLWNKDVRLREAQRLVHLRQSPWSICQKTAAHKVAGSDQANISLVFSSFLSLSSHC